MIPYLATLGGCAMLTLFIVYLARARFSERSNEVELRIEQLLPQTQCAQCGYPGCKPYAQAIAKGEAINRCPPGGEAVIEALATLLNRPATPLADDLKPVPVPLVARVVEEDCIGCTLCIKACPVDAIIGSQNQMHTVIEALCTGCELCLPPCPVDCIELLEKPEVALRLVPKPESNQPCIMCGACVPACPKHLDPQRLFLAFDMQDKTAQAQLSSCVECTLCDQVCPSHLPLTQTFKAMKANAAARDIQAAAALQAEARYLQRQRRMQQAEVQLVRRPDRKAAKALIDSLAKEPSS